MSWQDDVASAWNALRNEAHGRGTVRHVLGSEAQRAAQARVLDEYADFREFAADTVMSAFDTKWHTWRARYNETREVWAAAMGHTATPGLGEGSFIADTLQQASSEYAAVAEQLGLQRKIATVLAVIAACGLAAFALNRGRNRG